MDNLIRAARCLGFPLHKNLPASEEALLSENCVHTKLLGFLLSKHGKSLFAQRQEIGASFRPLTPAKSRNPTLAFGQENRPLSLQPQKLTLAINSFLLKPVKKSCPWKSLSEACCKLDYGLHTREEVNNALATRGWYGVEAIARTYIHTHTTQSSKECFKILCA